MAFICQQGNGGAAAATPGADAILDVILARIGISQYFIRLDALTASPQFAAAAAGDTGVRPVTRDEAAAAMAADDGAKLYGRPSHNSSQRVGTAALKLVRKGLAHHGFILQLCASYLSVRPAFPQQLMQQLDAVASTQAEVACTLTDLSFASGIYDEDQPESRQRSAGSQKAKENPFDYAFAGFVAALKDTLKQRILEAYERPFAVRDDVKPENLATCTSH